MGSLKGIAQVANDSAVCNCAQLNCTEDGTVIVPVYNCTDFFATRFTKIPGIKILHHFRFDSSEPGVVYVMTQSDSIEVKKELLKNPWSPDASELLSTISPKGLSVDRQWYLYDSIREFCPAEDRDLTCPEPAVPR